MKIVVKGVGVEDKIGYSHLFKKVKISGNGCYIYVPRSWIGTQVVIIALEPVPDEGVNLRGSNKPHLSKRRAKPTA
jgi:putative transposon-encoded protein